jgi:hypothetical protein
MEMSKDFEKAVGDHTAKPPFEKIAPVLLAPESVPSYRGAARFFLASIRFRRGHGIEKDLRASMTKSQANG